MPNETARLAFHNGLEVDQAVGGAECYLDVIVGSLPDGTDELLLEQIERTYCFVVPSLVLHVCILSWRHWGARWRGRLRRLAPLPGGVRHGLVGGRHVLGRELLFAATPIQPSKHPHLWRIREFLMSNLLQHSNVDVFVTEIPEQDSLLLPVRQQPRVPHLPVLGRSRRVRQWSPLRQVLTAPGHRHAWA